jgi:hypothetical protein
MKSILRSVFILLFFFPLGIVNSAAPPPDTNAKVKSVFVYNFTKYIEWPKNYKEGSFVIGVLGNSPVVPELSQMASSKKVGTQPLEIKVFLSVSAITKCHILYVSEDMAGSLKDVINKVKGSSTLIVTEKAGMARQGSAINFIVQENKQKFELNKANAEKYSLSVSSNLTTFAIVVE